jgi:hypothetical protein
MHSVLHDADYLYDVLARLSIVDSCMCIVRTGQETKQTTEKRANINHIAARERVAVLYGRFKRGHFIGVSRLKTP